MVAAPLSRSPSNSEKRKRKRREEHPDQKQEREKKKEKWKRKEEKKTHAQIYLINKLIHVCNKHMCVKKKEIKKT